MVTGPGLTLQALEAGMIPKQDTVLEFVRAWWGRHAVPLPAKIGLTACATILPGGKDSPRVLCLCKFALSERADGLRGRHLLNGCFCLESR